MKRIILLTLILITFLLSSCGGNGNASGGGDTPGNAGLEAPSHAGSTVPVQNGTPDVEKGQKIKAAVRKNCNYIYHMLSVSNCGYDNEYGRKYKPLHDPADLQILKNHEDYITVAGGEHSGALYQLCVALPASLEDDVSLPAYFEALIDLFETDNIAHNFEKYKEIYEQSFATAGAAINLDSLKEFYAYNEPLKKEIAAISKVMHTNYGIYSEQVWEASSKELAAVADALNRQFSAADYSSKWESLLNCEYSQDAFWALMCNSIEGGPNCIDISNSKDVFYHSGEYASTAKLISHEFGIYLLKEALKNTDAFQGFAYYELVEGLAEYFNIIVSGGHTEWDWGEEYIHFYQQLKEAEPEISAEEMFLRAADYYVPATASE